MSTYIPVTITQDNLQWAIRYNILEAWRILVETKLRVSRACPMPPVDANGNQINLVADATTLWSAVNVATLAAMRAGTFVIPPNPNSFGNLYGPGIYPSKPQGGPNGPDANGRVLGDTAGDGN